MFVFDIYIYNKRIFLFISTSFLKKHYKFYIGHPYIICEFNEVTIKRKKEKKEKFVSEIYQEELLCL